MSNAQARGSPDSATDKQASDLSAFVYELRIPINTVITQTNSLLEAASSGRYEIFVPDLKKILRGGEQLLGLVNKTFQNQSINEKKTDWSFFTSTIRHDLRTPVNAIIGYSEMLLEDSQDEEEQALQEALQKTHAAGQRALSLINELIYLSQQGAAESGGVQNKASKIKPAPSPQASLSKPPGAVSESKSMLETDLQHGYLLVVDDKESNRDLLSRQLQRYGFEVDLAENGRYALEMIAAHEYDLVLLDIIMPEMNGYEVLLHLRGDEKLRHMPVIMISALDEIDTVVHCIENGAWDYLQKPFNPIILRAKIVSHLERKRLRDREQKYLRQLQQEQEKSERLLLNILPAPIAERLKQGERTIADNFSEATILFADLVRFTELSKTISAAEIVERLSDIFLAFDILAELYGLEKIKTIGDAYMLAGGLPTPRPDHAEAVAEMALDLRDAITRLNKQNDTNFEIRIGIHTGPVVAGVIGKQKFNYDLWGESVNIASRMESHSLPGRIQISESTYRAVKDKFLCEKRGSVDIKGIGEMITYWLLERKA